MVVLSYCTALLLINFTYHTSVPVSTRSRMGDRSRFESRSIALSWYLVNHTGQLSLTIPTMIGEIYTDSNHDHKLYELYFAIKSI